MDRSYYLKLAASGARMPIGTDLVLKEHPDHESIAHDGQRLGRVVAEAAKRYRTPLAFPLMDLTLEKLALIEQLGIDAPDPGTYQFDRCPGRESLNKLEGHPPIPRMAANLGAIRYIANFTDLVAVGMSIGPFSLATKLLSDPITPVFLSGSGVTAGDDEEVRLLECVLELSTRMVLESVRQQCRAGAEAVFIAEPAANKVYFSPNQLADGSDIFERYVMAPNRRVKKVLADHGVDLFFHCCGELIDEMVEQFCRLDPAILSLGSSRRLWDDARLVPKNVVLYGNLPSKKFYSDDAITIAQVAEQAEQIVARMREVRHPFILGSECDVLSVPGCEGVIRSKVEAMLPCGCAH